MNVTSVTIVNYLAVLADSMSVPQEGACSNVLDCCLTR